MTQDLNQVPFVLLENFPGTDLPGVYQTPGSSGMDLRSAIDADLPPGERILIPCGFCMKLPAHLEAQIRPRSGLALKHGVTMLNSPGTVDSDYRGEIKVLMINHGQHTFQIVRGERIAQMVMTEVTKIRWQAVKELPESIRGEGGFGHTGK